MSVPGIWLRALGRLVVVGLVGTWGTALLLIVTLAVAASTSIYLAGPWHPAQQGVPCAGAPCAGSGAKAPSWTETAAAQWCRKELRDAPVTGGSTSGLLCQGPNLVRSTGALSDTPTADDCPDDALLAVAPNDRAGAAVPLLTRPCVSDPAR